MFKQHQSQHLQFTYRAMPILFHNQSIDYIDFLEKDGMKFIKFWWDHAGKEVDDDLLSSSKGLAYEIRDYGDGRRIVLITLPPPQKEPEAFFLGMVTRPPKRHFFPWKNLSHVFVLGLAGEPGPEAKTKFGEITPKRVVTVPISSGHAPELELFYGLVCEELKRLK